MASGASHHMVDVDGLMTHYVTSGEGPTLLIIHGGAPGACAMVNWGKNIVPMGLAGFNVIAFDQPGYGETENPTDYSMNYRLEHTKSFISAMGLERFHVMGNSQGAYIAARVALDDPRVEKLVLVSSGTLAPPGSPEAQAIAQHHAEVLGSYEPGMENMRKLSLGTLYRKELVTDEFVRLRYEMSKGRLHEASLKRRNAAKAPPIFNELKDLNCPTLVLSGLRDAGVPVERTLALFDFLPHAELHVFTHAAHWVQWDQSDRFNTLVEDFLQS